MAVREIALRINGRTHTGRAEPRKTLADFIREECGLTGTHLGCEHGVCGACTILMDGEAVRSCLMFAVQAEGAELMTVEGLADGNRLHPIQQAYWEQHALQCGFCTPGFLMTTLAFLRDTPRPSEREIREALAGNLCRCTGYQNIVKAVAAAADTLASGAHPDAWPAFARSVAVPAPATQPECASASDAPNPPVSKKTRAASGTRRKGARDQSRPAKRRRS
ncbi:MAG TPA: (2Fe-2S)-binding protein [bacterium]|nr:(2Fe-2S)-binding protein [bacterium]